MRYTFLMSFEQPKSAGEGSEWLRLQNAMQIALARKFYGFDIGEEEMRRWIEEHSRDFDVLVSNKPEIVERFRDNPTAALTEAEEALYKNKLAA
ncbi:MAG: hypothetical protein G01um101472_439 [Parcubacteria group bacterium Gr01-1014_72]|nr:MAG: hypothetical protein G01um101472_439 [Parcubacteria group bacterium Gr01-1014_72]